MKKLFIIGSFLTLFLFVFGCQSESPVQPGENTADLTNLQKSVDFTVEYSDDIVTCSWGSYGGAKSYVLSYFQYPNGNYFLQLGEFGAIHGKNMVVYPVDVTNWTSGSYQFRLQCLNGKDQEIGSAGEFIDIP